MDLSLKSAYTDKGKMWLSIFSFGNQRTQRLPRAGYLFMLYEVENDGKIYLVRVTFCLYPRRYIFF